MLIYWENQSLNNVYIQSIWTVSLTYTATQKQRILYSLLQTVCSVDLRMKVQSIIFWIVLEDSFHPVFLKKFTFAVTPLYQKRQPIYYQFLQFGREYRQHFFEDCSVQKGEWKTWRAISRIHFEHYSFVYFQHLNQKSVTNTDTWCNTYRSTSALCGL